MIEFVRGNNPMKFKKGQKIIYKERGLLQDNIKEGKIEEVYGVYAKINGEWRNLNYVDILKVYGLTRAEYILAIMVGITIGVIIVTILETVGFI
jgi:hypothetical protein